MAVPITVKQLRTGMSIMVSPKIWIKVEGVTRCTDPANIHVNNTLCYYKESEIWIKPQ